MSTVTVVGIGRIGFPLLERLVSAGHRVIAHDARPDLEGRVQRAGATWSPILADAVAASEIMFTVLPGSPELEAAMLDADGLLDAVPTGAVWIDLTSAAPDLGLRLADAAQDRHLDYLDAPIGGGVSAMRNGTAALYVGGEATTLERIRPVLQALAENIHHMGSHGAGYLTKVLINTMWFGQAAMTAEVLLLAQRAGIAPAALSTTLLGSAADSAFARRDLSALLQGDYLTDFGLDRCVEELESVRRFASAHALPHPMIATITQLHHDALEHFGAVDGELMAVALLEARAGSLLRAPPESGHRGRPAKTPGTGTHESRIR